MLRTRVRALCARPIRSRCGCNQQGLDERRRRRLGKSNGNVPALRDIRKYLIRSVFGSRRVDVQLPHRPNNNGGEQKTVPDGLSGGVHQIGSHGFPLFPARLRELRKPGSMQVPVAGSPVGKLRSGNLETAGLESDRGLAEKCRPDRHSIRPALSIRSLRRIPTDSFSGAARTGPWPAPQPRNPDCIHRHRRPSLSV